MALIRRFPLTFFLLATVVITYVLGIAAYLSLKGIQTSLGTDFPGVNDLVMKFGPSLGGILTIGLLAGRKGLGELFRRCTRWRFHPLLYVGAILIQPAILLAVLLSRGYEAEARSVSPGTAIGVFAGQLLLGVFLGGGLGEELGWRGFMLPRLCERYSPLMASLLVAIAWFAWHIPAYVLADKGESDPVLPFAVIVFSFSIVLTWAYFRSQEGLLLPVLLHGAINASFYAMEELLPGVTGAPGFQPGFDWAVAAVWCVLAGIVVVKWGPDLGRETVTPSSAPPTYERGVR
jgi:membrane protease YdiL (CAAX protease family)